MEKETKELVGETPSTQSFDDFLKSKKIDPNAFKKGQELQYKELKVLFDQVHPNSFVQQKLFLINGIRRAFQYEVEEQKLYKSRPEKSEPSEKAESKESIATQPKVKIKPKVQIKPRIKSDSESSIEPRSKPKIQPRPKIQAKPKIGTSSEDKVGSEIQPKRKIQVKPKIQPKPKAD